MTLATLVNIASLLSSVAVLVSVVYLGLQIRQGARNQRSVMDRGRSQQVSDWLQFIAGSDIAPIVLRGHACDPAMTPAEHQRYIWSIYPLLLHYEDSFYQHREGMLGDAQYASILNHMRNSAGTPGIRAAWAELRGRFPADFSTFGDTVMRETAAPDT